MKKLSLAFFLLFCPLPAFAADAAFVYSGTPHIVDGDSLYIGNTEIRLLCIDAVELHQTCLDANGIDYACGEQAKQALIAAAAGRRVVCEGTSHDKYFRPLAWCHAGDDNLNTAEVAAGWAVSMCSETRGAEAEARDAALGIWQGTFERPSQWRHAHPWKKHKSGL